MLFMLLFYFIFVNMYLATMMSNYAKTVSEQQVAMVKSSIEKQARAMETFDDGAPSMGRRSSTFGRRPSFNFVRQPSFQFLAKKKASTKAKELTVHNWRSLAACEAVETLVKRRAADSDAYGDEESEDGQGVVAEEDAEEGAVDAKGAEEAALRLAYLKDMLFSRVGDPDVAGLADGAEFAPRAAVDNNYDAAWLLAHLKKVEPIGAEFWLDTLVTCIEKVGGDGLLADVFSTEEMRSTAVGATAATTRMQQLK